MEKGRGKMVYYHNRNQIQSSIYVLKNSSQYVSRQIINISYAIHIRNSGDGTGWK